MSAGPSQKHELGTERGTDLFGVFADLAPADQAAWDRAREFTARVLPEMSGHWDAATYPIEFVAEMGSAGLLTDGCVVDGYETLSPLAAGLVTMEVSRADGSLAAMLGVQGGLCVRSLALFASEEQKARYLPGVAAGTLPCAFALTEPNHGSDSVGLETTARRDGDTWVLDGWKKWIGNGAARGLTIVWARNTETEQVNGFLVEQSTPGYSAEVITGKGALRAIHQAEIRLDRVRVAENARLPGVGSFKDLSRCLVESRVSVGWSALGHAVSAFDAAAAYAGERAQFGAPLASHQMVQERLAHMLEDVTAAQLVCRRAAELQEAGTLTQPQASMVKFQATRAARRVMAVARDMLGGNGILLQNHVMRHMADMEALHTYEGTESVQALILGRHITGVSAFV